MEFVHPIYDIKKIVDIKKVLRGTNISDHCLLLLASIRAFGSVIY